MKRFLLTSAAIIAAATSSSQASPSVNSAQINQRVFNDMPLTTVTTPNTGLAHITISESIPGFSSGNNRHNWRASSDGGVTATQFGNGDSFSFKADVTLSGTAAIGEGGLNVSPWWSPNNDGQFLLNPVSGEVAIFGGRLPFYSFTGNGAPAYVRGTTVTLGISYAPMSLSGSQPAMIQYQYGTYFSPWINFDEGNPAEGHGSWGDLWYTEIGGYVQDSGQQGAGVNFTADWNNVSYTPAPGAIAMLGLGGLLAARRRR